MHIHVTEAVGWAAWGVGTGLSFASTEWIAGFTLAVSGLGVAGISLYQKWRETKRTQDVEDEKALKEGMQRKLDLVTFQLQLKTEEVLHDRAEVARLQATIDALRASCPYREQCPVNAIKRYGIPTSES